MASCSVCGENVSVAFGVQHRKCKHWSHTKCVKGMFNVRECPQCLGKIEAPQIQEPIPEDGIDYVVFPGKRWNTITSKAASLISSKFSSSEPVWYKELRKRTPLTKIMANHKQGLQHMLKDGVVIEDFLDNGYTWEDLKQYQDFQKGPKRAKDTLIALGVRANHLRDYPEALPPLTLRKDLGLSSGDFCETLGLCFPTNACLQCDGDDHWNLQNCVDMGLSIHDLVDFGLESIQQYEDMLFGISKQQAEQAENALGVTEQVLLRLDDWEKPPAAKFTPSPSPTITSNSSTPKYVQRKVKNKEKYDRHGFKDRHH